VELLKHTVRSPHGQLVIADNWGMVKEYDVLTCGHCQYTWKVEPGSGTRRGWCFACMQPLCGKYKCSVGCDPIEAQIQRGGPF
jgi:hypothetical protein